VNSPARDDKGVQRNDRAGQKLRGGSIFLHARQFLPGRQIPPPHAFRDYRAIPGAMRDATPHLALEGPNVIQ
jgi:hypothetical protein